MTKAQSHHFALDAVDRLLTRDGRKGRLRELCDGGFPLILLTHWQSLFSDGMEGGLAGLAETLARIERHLGDRVEWLRLGAVARLAR